MYSYKLFLYMLCFIKLYFINYISYKYFYMYVCMYMIICICMMMIIISMTTLYQIPNSGSLPDPDLSTCPKLFVPGCF